MTHIQSIKSAGGATVGVNWLRRNSHGIRNFCRVKRIWIQIEKFGCVTFSVTHEEEDLNKIQKREPAVDVKSIEGQIGRYWEFFLVGETL